MSHYGFTWEHPKPQLHQENARLKQEVQSLRNEIASLKAQLAVVSPPDDNYGKGVPETSYADSRNKFLTEAKKQGYNNVREYIVSMATKYSVDVEEARIAFMACGYEEWGTGFIETLMEMESKI